MTTKEALASHYTSRYRKSYQVDVNTCDLELTCSTCREQDTCIKDFSNNSFSRCLLNIMVLEMDTLFEYITIDSSTCIMTAEIEILKDFIVHSRMINAFNEKISKNARMKCDEKGTTCPVRGLTDSFSKMDYWINFPSYHRYIQEVNEFLEHNRPCKKCLKLKGDEVQKHLEMLGAMRINQEVERRGESMGDIRYNPFNRIVLKRERDLREKTIIKHELGEVVEDYDVDGAGLMHCEILERNNEMERFYRVKLDLPFTSRYFSSILAEIERELERDASILNASNFNDTLHRVMSIARSRLASLVKNIDGQTLASIVNLASFSLLGLGKLYPLLVDDRIETIFIDSRGGPAYIDHVTHKRCVTNIVLEDWEEKALNSKMRLETNKNLNALSTTLKCTIQNEFFQVRINIDVEPMNFEGFSLDVRRMNKQVFDIIDLIENGTLPVHVAAFLIFCIQARLNVTIIGTTKSGKTTLLNALDMLYPKHFRKIYVEDAIETVKQHPGRSHQLKFQVASGEGKAEIIKDLLHRTPDILILGELLVERETRAFFHALSTGMRGLQTIHAASSIEFLKRMQEDFSISRTKIESLDFVVLLKMFESGPRKVMEVVEFGREDDGQIQPRALSKLDPVRGTWPDIRARGSKKISRFIETTKLDATSLDDYLDSIKKVLNHHLARKRDGDYEREPFLKEINAVYIDHVKYL